MMRRLKRLVGGKKKRESRSISQAPALGYAGLSGVRTLLRSEIDVLLTEAREISSEITHELRGYAKRLKNESDVELRADLGSIDAELLSIRRGLQRIALSQWDTRRLLDEWHEWEQVRGASHGEHGTAQDRQELIASELAVRGRDPRMPVVAQASSPVVPLVSDEVVVTQSIESIELPVASPSAPWLADWPSEHAVMVEAEYSYWNDLVSGMQRTPLADPSSAMAMYKGLRRAHAEQRLLDRMTGTKRDRLAVFNV